jgi:hypothetical protein
MGLLVHTFGTRLNLAIFHHLVAVGQLSQNTAIFLVNENDSTSTVCALAALGIALPRSVVSWVVSGELLPSSFACLGLCLLGGSWWVRRSGAFEECSALGENSLESVDIFLNTRSRVGRREFDAGKGTAVRAKVPTRNQVACRWLVVDLGRGRKRQIKLGRKMQVKVEVLFAIGASS